MNDSHLSGQRAPRAEEPKRKNGEDKAGSSDDGGWDRDSEPGAAGRAPGKRDRKTSKRKAATGPGLVRREGPGGHVICSREGPGRRVTCSREGPGGPVTCSPFRPASPPAPRSPLLPLGEESKRVSGAPTAPRPEKRVRALPHPPSRPAALAPLRPSSTRPRSQRGRRLLVEELLVEGRNPVVRRRGRAGTVGLGSQELPTSRRESLARPPLNAD